MADQNVTQTATEKLIKDYNMITGRALSATGLLITVINSLEGFEGDDREGVIWGANETLRVAKAMIEEFFKQADEMKIVERIRGLH